MLLQRTEHQVRHSIFSSSTGLTDFIGRNKENLCEVQISTAVQNYTLFTELFHTAPVRIVPSADEEDFWEDEKSAGSADRLHRCGGRFMLHCGEQAEITIGSVLLESTRAVRIFQESGTEADTHAMEGKSPAATVDLESFDGGVTLRVLREFCGVLVYEAKIIFSGARKTGGRIFTLHGGEHGISAELSLTGPFPKSDDGPSVRDAVSLLNEDALSRFYSLSGGDRREMMPQLESLAALARKRRLLAGSPRFLTYFGRDSLISAALLTGCIRKEVGVQIFRSVLERLSPAGEVAHEETVGEYSIRPTPSGTKDGTVIPPRSLNYSMVDDDFLLSAALLRWTDEEGTEDIVRLLDEDFTASDGRTRSGWKLLALNLGYCLSRYGEGLIPYHTGIPVGDWRDSLAHQEICYSYEVNAGLADAFPAILAKLCSRLPALEPYLSGAEEKNVPNGLPVRKISRQNGFLVNIDLSNIREKVRNWLRIADFSLDEITILSSRLEESLAETESYRFYAMALDGNRNPIAVQHNDAAFTMLFGEPKAEELDTMLIPLETPFPLGLRTDVGLLVSNPLFASSERVRRMLNRSHYHGLVIWPLMHHMLRHAVRRQLKRPEVGGDPSLAARLLSLRKYLDDLPGRIGDFSASELWTFRPGREDDIPLTFGAETGSTTESNPLQLWSSLGFTTRLLRSG